MCQTLFPACGRSDGQDSCKALPLGGSQSSGEIGVHALPKNRTQLLTMISKPKDENAENDGE